MKAESCKTGNIKTAFVFGITAVTAAYIVVLAKSRRKKKNENQPTQTADSSGCLPFLQLKQNSSMQNEKQHIELYHTQQDTSSILAKQERLRELQKKSGLKNYA